MPHWNVDKRLWPPRSPGLPKDCSQSMLLQTPTASIPTEQTGEQFLRRPTGFGGFAMKVSFAGKSPTTSIPTDHRYSDQFKL